LGNYKFFISVSSIVSLERIVTERSKTRL